MAFEFSKREVADVTILDISGRMVLGTDGQKLRSALIECFQGGHPWLVVNCADLDFMDSSGLGDLIDAHGFIVRQGGILRLLNVNDGLLALLSRTRLDGLFDLYDDEEAALASFTEMNNRRTRQKLASFLQREV